MKRVFVLGAGFSKAINVTMPRLRELSDRVLEEPSLDHVHDPTLRDASRYGDDVERWLSALADPGPWLSESDQLRAKARFGDVSAAIARVVEQEDTKAARGEAPSWLGKLAGYWDRHEPTVITFNYDRLVELAYLGLGRQGEGCADLYAIPLTPTEMRRGGTWSDVHPPTFKLLKLHGSVSWWYSGPQGDPHGPIYLDKWAGQFGEGFAPQHAGLGDLTAGLQPMIIPPAATKSPFYTNQLVAAQWQKAARAIQELDDQDELVFMGYRMPLTDLSVASLISTNLAAKPSIVPVDLDGTVTSRLERILPSGMRLSGDFAGKSADPISDWVTANIDTAAPAI